MKKFKVRLKEHSCVCAVVEANDELEATVTALMLWYDGDITCDVPSNVEIESIQEIKSKDNEKD